MTIIGVRNAPQTVQRSIHFLLRNLLFCFVYVFGWCYGRVLLWVWLRVSPWAQSSAQCWEMQIVVTAGKIPWAPGNPWRYPKRPSQCTSDFQLPAVSCPGPPTINRFLTLIGWPEDLTVGAAFHQKVNQTWQSLNTFASTSSQYTIDIQHLSRKNNVFADVLSCMAEVKS